MEGGGNKLSFKFNSEKSPLGKEMISEEGDDKIVVGE